MDANQLWMDVTHRLGWTLVHSLWEGALIAAMLALLLALLRQATSQTRYVLSVTALAATVAAVLVTFQAVAPPAHPLIATASPTSFTLIAPAALKVPPAESLAPLDTDASGFFCNEDFR
jgi:hypothetical protein